MATDVATAVERWAQAAGQGQQRYTEGIQSTTKDPTALAIAQAQKLVTNFQASVSSGRWQRNLAKAGKAGWQAAALAKANNYGVGIAAGRGKYESAMGVWLPIINQAAAQVQTMPSNTIEDSAARSRAFMVALHNAKQSR
jgi:RES domain-containing protein